MEDGPDLMPMKLAPHEEQEGNSTTPRSDSLDFASLLCFHFTLILSSVWTWFGMWFEG